MTNRLKVLIFGALATVAVAIEFLQRGHLVDSIHLPLTLLGAAFGMVVGYFAAADIADSIPRGKRLTQILAVLAMPLFGLFAGTLLMRSLVLQAAFIGVSTTPQMATFIVEDSQRQRRKQFSSSRNYWLKVTRPNGGREFRVLVDQALYEMAGPNPAPGTHCLRLPVDQGRWGIRRASVPNYFEPPLGLDIYRRC